MENRKRAFNITGSKPRTYRAYKKRIYADFNSGVNLLAGVGFSYASLP